MTLNNVTMIIIRENEFPYYSRNTSLQICLSYFVLTNEFVSTGYDLPTCEFSIW